MRKAVVVVIISLFFCLPSLAEERRSYYSYYNTNIVYRGSEVGTSTAMEAYSTAAGYRNNVQATGIPNFMYQQNNVSGLLNPYNSSPAIQQNLPGTTNQVLQYQDYSQQLSNIAMPVNQQQPGQAYVAQPTMSAGVYQYSTQPAPSTVVNWQPGISSASSVTPVAQGVANPASYSVPTKLKSQSFYAINPIVSTQENLEDTNVPAVYAQPSSPSGQAPYIMSFQPSASPSAQPTAYLFPVDNNPQEENQSE